MGRYTAPENRLPTIICNCGRRICPTAAAPDEDGYVVTRVHAAPNGKKCLDRRVKVTDENPLRPAVEEAAAV